MDDIEKDGKSAINLAEIETDSDEDGDERTLLKKRVNRTQKRHA